MQTHLCLEVSSRSYRAFLPALLLPALLAGGSEAARAGDGTSPVIRTERFDRDPGWEGYNNRVVPKHVMLVRQDFGYSATHFAGTARGELGGVIQRSTTPASYAARIAPRTLDDMLTAAGSFAVTASQPGAGVFFGYIHGRRADGEDLPG